MFDDYRHVRAQTLELSRPLSAEDCQSQSMDHASPVKWHLAHTTWFFETFLPLRAGAARDPSYARLFNSYYNSVGDRIGRGDRGLMTRPSLEEVVRYRFEVDDALQRGWEGADERSRKELLPVVELGIHHEQQHQELILTDLKHLLFQNPVQPAYQSASPEPPGRPVPALRWVEFPAGLAQIGASAGDGFSFDNEQPRHPCFVPAFQLASRLVTCGEYLGFIEEGGYRRPVLWLSEGWDRVCRDKWEAPLYWAGGDGVRTIFTLEGKQPLNPAEPVSHVSYFEADAFARWAGARLPREEEWEIAARSVTPRGNLADSRRYHPRPLNGAPSGPELSQMFGDVWEWTQSPYVAYPGYEPPPGALGEYNGKFMCNQFVLRGGSCATPASHIRATYRNFFPPDARWQFTGIRLAKG